MMHVENISPNECTGCGGCVAVCHRDAVTMGTDEYGNYRPRIDETKCVNCQKCTRFCAKIHAASKAAPLQAYGAVGKDGDLVRKSASGGVFATVATALIAQKGQVYGAVSQCFEGKLQVYHTCASDAREMEKMQGSKYVQSRAWEVYRAVSQRLQKGETVLFTGTPCQVAAVKAYTGDPQNLVTMDLVCHGVPATQMLNEALTLFAKRLGGKLTDFSFRDKSREKRYTSRLTLRKGRRTKTYFVRARYLSFYHAFLQSDNFRESCYSCSYAGMERVSDITVGDYWGMEKHHSHQMQDRTDWSCVLVNTQKGKAFLEQYGKDLTLVESKPQWVAEENKQLRAPGEKGPHRARLLELYKKGGYKAVEKDFIKENGGALRYRLRLYKSFK